MFKRLFLTSILISLMAIGYVTPAFSAYLASNWYVQLTNVTGPFESTATSSAHIGVTTASGSATFRVTQSGEAPIGENALWSTPLVLDPFTTVGPISFDYRTYWTQPNLVLELWAGYLWPTDGQGGIVWSSSQTGLRSGHVVTQARPNAYTFCLRVVPEPSSIISLSSMCVAGMVLGLRKRIRAVCYHEPFGSTWKGEK
ncbi:MAG: PEP-CTERM sorting domain-containing protein [Armatimonadetes bacterium]|nr:PEP-CTERM sorting domain-containing protein [Armatimonadota bacterium]